MKSSYLSRDQAPESAVTQDLLPEQFPAQLKQVVGPQTVARIASPEVSLHPLKRSTEGDINLTVDELTGLEESFREQLSIHRLPCDFFTIPHDKISDIPFKGRKIQARLLKIVDGDTISVAIYCGHILKLKIRLEGVDAPELHPKPDDPVQVQAALKVKNYVMSLFSPDSSVNIRLLKLDKYGGRYVGHIYLSDGITTLSEHLLAKGYVKKYDGRAKSKWIASDFEAINRDI